MMSGIPVIVRVGGVVVRQLRSPGKLGVDVLLCLTELLYRLSQTTCEFRQFLRSKKQENHKENQKPFRAGQIGEEGDGLHGLCFLM